MKNFKNEALVICFFAVFALITAFTSDSLIAANPGEKTPVCHNGRLILVPPQAVEGHLSHGDREGSCYTPALTE